MNADFKSQLQSARDDAEAAKREADAKLQAAETRAQLIASDVSTREDALNEELRSLNDMLLLSQTRTQDLARELQEANASRAALRKQFDASLDQAREALEQDGATHGARILQLGQELQAARDDATQQREQLCEREERLHAEAQSANDLRGQVSTLEGELAQERAKFELEAYQHSQGLAKAREALEQDGATHGARISQLEQELQAARDDASQQREQSTQAQRTAEQQLEQLQKRLLESHEGAVSSEQLAATSAEQRESTEAQLCTLEGKYRAQVAEMEAQWQQQQTTAARVTSLSKEMASSELAKAEAFMAMSSAQNTINTSRRKLVGLMSAWDSSSTLEEALADELSDGEENALAVACQSLARAVDNTAALQNHVMASLNQKASDETAQREAAMEQCAHMERVLGEQTREKEELTQRTDELQRKFGTVQEEVAQLLKVAEASDREAQRAKEEKRKVEQRVQQGETQQQASQRVLQGRIAQMEGQAHEQQEQLRRGAESEVGAQEEQRKLKGQISEMQDMLREQEDMLQHSAARECSAMEQQQTLKQQIVELQARGPAQRVAFLRRAWRCWGRPCPCP